MKNINLLIWITLVLLSSCKTAHISIQVLKPAQINVPTSIERLTLLNRSLAAQDNLPLNILEGAISGESPLLDRYGSEQCMKGTFNELQNSPKYKVQMSGNLNYRGTGTRQFPTPLPWETVEEICRVNNADALATLEVFDSNNSVLVAEKKEVKKENGKTLEYISYVATLRVNVESGWRIYYPNRHEIVDQNIYTDYMTWNRTADKPKTAQSALPSLDAAVKEAGYHAGIQYAKRISPLWIWVSRMYFKKGNDELVRAKRYVEINDWKGASAIWKEQISNTQPKIPGYASYNLALAYEMEGDLVSALDWAKKSYFYGNKNARYYIQTLETRINDQEILKNQLNK